MSKNNVHQFPPRQENFQPSPAEQAFEDYAAQVARNSAAARFFGIVLLCVSVGAMFYSMTSGLIIFLYAFLCFYYATETRREFYSELLDTRLTDLQDQFDEVEMREVAPQGEGSPKMLVYSPKFFNLH